MALLLPNIIWIAFPPASIPALPPVHGLIGTILERLEVVGRVVWFAVPFVTQRFIYGAQNGKRIIDDHMVKLVTQSVLE